MRQLDCMAVAAALVLGPQDAAQELATLERVFTSVRAAERYMSKELWHATKRLLFCAVATSLARCSASARARARGLDIKNSTLLAVHIGFNEDLFKHLSQQSELAHFARVIHTEITKILPNSSGSPTYSSAREGDAQAFCLVEASVELCLHAMTAASIDMLPLFSDGLPIPAFVFPKHRNSQ